MISLFHGIPVLPHYLHPTRLYKKTCFAKWNIHLLHYEHKIKGEKLPEGFTSVTKIKFGVTIYTITLFPYNYALAPF